MRVRAPFGVRSISAPRFVVESGIGESSLLSLTVASPTLSVLRPSVYLVLRRPWRERAGKELSIPTPTLTDRRPREEERRRHWCRARGSGADHTHAL